jgi:exodeoxyribonuclease V beta subunit
VALIDEFQDTDAIQYRIFDAIYRVEANDAATALVLIGDPKQAIYAFRGADIYTYLAARAATAGRLYTLGRNFRSTHAMVRATNRCFQLAEEQDGRPAPSCSAARRATRCPSFRPTPTGARTRSRPDGQPLAALNIWRLPPPDDGEPMSKGAYLEAMADVCASEMVRLLNLGQRGEAGFAGDDGLRALRQADLAVLVNNRSEADAIRGALASRGVRSVYLSEKDSVFQRPEAFELQLWLSACAEPDDGRALRAALATQTLGLDWASSTASTTTRSPGTTTCCSSAPTATAGAARACCRCCAACSTTSACRPACWPPAAAASAASPTCCTWPSCSSRPAACSTANTR